MKTAMDYRSDFRRDAEYFSTPLFPPHGRRQSHCTAPDFARYEPVGSDAHALRRIIEQSDLIEAGGRTWLLVELTRPLFDYLVMYGASEVDDEDGGDSEPDACEEGPWS